MNTDKIQFEYDARNHIIFRDADDIVIGDFGVSDKSFSFRGQGDVCVQMLANVVIPQMTTDTGVTFVLGDVVSRIDIDGRVRIDAPEHMDIDNSAVDFLERLSSDLDQARYISSAVYDSAPRKEMTK